MIKDLFLAATPITWEKYAYLEPFTRDELEMAITSLKPGKAPG